MSLFLCYSSGFLWLFHPCVCHSVGIDPTPYSQNVEIKKISWPFQQVSSHLLKCYLLFDDVRAEIVILMMQGSKM